MRAKQHLDPTLLTRSQFEAMHRNPKEAQLRSQLRKWHASIIDSQQQSK